jgi:hypothetical protein
MGSLDNIIWEDVLDAILDFSVVHGWCGVTIGLIQKTIRRKLNPAKRENFWESVEQMIQAGLLEMPYYKKWRFELQFSTWRNWIFFPWYGIFFPRIICPTNKLAEKILENIPKPPKKAQGAEHLPQLFP